MTIAQSFAVGILDQIENEIGDQFVSIELPNVKTIN